MISPASKKECCGCNACIARCPRRCIAGERDAEGFSYPVADAARCVDCGQCERVCPILHKPSRDSQYEVSRVFAAYHTDDAIRGDSTSGGVFSALARAVLDEGGSVAGAVYNEDHTVSHVISADPEVLGDMRGSKYLQSDFELHRQLEELLKRGGKALVCGTPCQIAGLYNYLGRDYENLLTCDFICLGVNSPKVFLKYLDMLEKEFRSEAVRVKFKDKTFGWHRFAVRVDFADGRSYCKDRYQDPYFVGYLQYRGFARPSCYDCRFKDRLHPADITLGDFWGIEKVDPAMDQDRGTSAVMVNSGKGMELYRRVAGLTFREFTYEDLLPGNSALRSSLVPREDNRAAFSGTWTGIRLRKS